ncbi:MAG: hypothetical protein LBM27_00455 [Lactobacillaceae bacterium]|jgi:hypothetical protein|nr:hypothetical protein [Lactobacillaceae bacterium]
MKKDLKIVFKSEQKSPKIKLSPKPKVKKDNKKLRIFYLTLALVALTVGGFFVIQSHIQNEKNRVLAEKIIKKDKLMIREVLKWNFKNVHKVTFASVDNISYSPATLKPSKMYGVKTPGLMEMYYLFSPQSSYYLTGYVNNDENQSFSFEIDYNWDIRKMNAVIWFDYDSPVYEISKNYGAADLPNEITDVDGKTVEGMISFNDIEKLKTGINPQELSGLDIYANNRKYKRINTDQGHDYKINKLSSRSKE